MAADIKEGSTVRLKSGGPVMTVEVVDPDTQTASCSWFDDKNQYQRQMFNPVALNLVDSN